MMSVARKFIPGFSVWFLWVFLLVRLVSSTASAEEPKRVQIKVMPSFYDPSRSAMYGTQRLTTLMKEDPALFVTQWGGISLPGAGWNAPLMMSIAGNTGPDVMYSHFHLIRNDIHQGFLTPLNEWIGEDLNGNGQVDPDEAKWDGWKDVPPLWRYVATVNGKIYGIPVVTRNYAGIMFRADMARAAGLNPNQPPQNWDEFVYWCQKLTDPAKKVPGVTTQRGQKGVGLPVSGWQWLPWLHAAGGESIVQVRRSPKDGKEHVFPPDTTVFRTPDGEDLSAVPSVWRASFGSEEGIRACAFYHRLCWMKWLVHPATHEPVNLTGADLQNGYVMVNQQKLTFTPVEVITGVARGDTGQRGVVSNDSYSLMARGEVAMVPYSVDSLQNAGAGLGIDADLLSWFPFPAEPGPRGRRVVMAFNHYAALGEGVKRRPKMERDKAWEVLRAVTDKEAADHLVRQQVLAGLARFVNPIELKRLGFQDYIKDIPSAIRKNYAEMEDGRIGVVTEPYMGFWITMDDALRREVLSLIVSETGEKFDYATAIRNVEHKGNTGVMFGYPKEVLDRYRPYARGIFTLMVAVLVVFVGFIIRSLVAKPAGTSRPVYRGWLPWLFVAPALLLIGLWSYYPLARGMVMAFQDYRIAGDTQFVGLNNFIQLALDRTFWASLWRTGYFVFLNMALAFTAPIVLALLLSEVPHGKIFFRTLFFLPQVSSGLVIALLWRLMYDPSPEGLLNQIISLLNRLPFVEIHPQTWLQDPRLAMICCVIPTVWASMGMASLIYLAALKGVPEEIYEAADVDGAGVPTKLIHITLPTLLPLVIINFVGAFVATFQNMGNIFLLTFGGPGEVTMVVGLRIWVEAYANLRFSMATSMAWILGSLLISFSYVQIRFLRRVEFKKADWK